MCTLSMQPSFYVEFVKSVINLIASNENMVCKYISCTPFGCMAYNLISKSNEDNRNSVNEAILFNIWAF